MSLPSADPSHIVSGIQPLPVVVAYGPAAVSVTRRISTTDRRGSVGVLSFAENDSGSAAPLLPGGSVVRYELPLAIGGEIAASDVRRRIAEIARERRVTLLLIECDPTIDAMALADTLSHTDGEDEYAKLAQFHSSVMAVDASTLIDLLVRQRPPGEPWTAAAVAEQVERAQTVVLQASENAADGLLAAAIVTALNPVATIVPADEATFPDGIFDEPDGASRRGRAGGAGSGALTAGDRIRTFSEGITSAVYSSRRPFHPQRFREFLKHDLDGVIRAKGFFWLATQMDVVGGLNVAGPERQAAAVGHWWAAMANQLPEGATPPAEIRAEWLEPFGDRRQALSFVGLSVDAARLLERLDGCVLTDSEMTAGERSWQAWPDPFPKWSHAPHEHHCDHHCDHDCCQQCDHECGHEHAADHHRHHHGHCSCHDH